MVSRHHNLCFTTDVIMADSVPTPSTVVPRGKLHHVRPPASWNLVELGFGKRQDACAGRIWPAPRLPVLVQCWQGGRDYRMPVPLFVACRQARRWYAISNVARSARSCPR